MDKNIKIIEQALGYPLSDEQVAILQSNFDNPTLVNACAGAGKTTTMIISILYQAMRGNVLPINTLCVTFSKEAQEDMTKKYQQLVTKLAKVYPQANTWQQPDFRTFHSLFLEALKVLYTRWQPDITSWDKYIPELYQQIKHPKEALTNYENVERKMNLCDQLINHNYSYDGINLNMNNRQVQIILNNLEHDSNDTLTPLLQFFGVIDSDIINDYKRVVTTYAQIKQRENKIDFSDIQTYLSRTIQNQPNNINLLHQYFNGIFRVYLDEFQDISQIQWDLITQIMPKKALDHLVAIGDDDQSIYRFRGSDPTFILNFAKRMPNAVTFNLSTNYRTYANILDTVKPMIESNSLRLTKTLKAFNSGGKIIRDIRHVVDNDQAIQQFIDDVKANPNGHYAILARNNSNLSILTDRLANTEIFSDYGQSKQFIFQNTKLHKIIYNLMHALYQDEFDLLIQYSNRIGFKKMKNFLLGYQKDYKTISNFFDQSSWRDDANQLYQGTKSWNKHQYGDMIDKLVTIRSDLKQINEYKAAEDPITKKYLPQTIFKMVRQLTADYFDYMNKNHYLGISSDAFEQVMDYLNMLIKKSPTMEAFFIVENNKKLAMEGQNLSQQRYHVQALTFHRSKGLEFNEILLYTDSTCGVSRDNCRLAKLFPAKLTIDQTIEQIDKEPILSLALMSANGLTSLEQIEQALYPDDPEARTRLDNTIYQVIDSNYAYVPSMHLNLDAVKQNQNLKNLVYLEINSIAKNVEEEKHLMYVAVTRAKDRIIFDQAETNDVITQTLDLPLEEGLNTDE